MKNKIKILVIVFALILTTPVLADSIMESINVVMNTVKVQVNGQDLNSESILYNGTTYLPLRKVAESVGKDVAWNQETMTANIVDKDLPGVITSGFSDDSYMADFTDGFGIMLSINKETRTATELKAKEGIVLGTYTKEIKDKSTITKPTITGFKDGNRINPVKYETYSLIIPQQFKEGFHKVDFFENFNNDSDSIGAIYFNDNVDSIYYDDGIHKCKLYFK
jgi:hypothetical protein